MGSESSLASEAQQRRTRGQTRFCPTQHPAQQPPAPTGSHQHRTMKIFFLGALVFCGLFPQGTSCHTDTTPVGEPADIISDPTAWVELARCEDLPEDKNAIIDNVEVTGAIVCDSPKGIIIPSGFEVVIRAEHDLAISGLQILVAPGARLSFMAGESIILARSQAMEDAPVLFVGGELVVSAGSRVSGETKHAKALLLEPQEKQEDLLARDRYGVVYYSSGQEVVFAANAIVVADEVDYTSEIAPQQRDPPEQANETEHLPDGAEDEPATKENAPPIPDANIMTDHLKQGNTLHDGSLVPSDGAVELWAGMHGSVFFAKYMTAKKLSEDGKPSKRMELSTLIPANQSKVQGVLNIRAKLKEEAAGGKRAGIGKKNVLRWTPWGRRFNQQVDVARQHSGEVAMTVDNRGCLEVTVDGCCVLSRSGSHAWEWVNRCSYRKNSPAYELHVVENGMEVQLDAKKVWGVAVPDTKEKESPDGRSVFGITAADIW